MKLSKRLPTYFISHGGGPWPWLKKEMPFYDKLEASLAEMPNQIGIQPAAILMISAHWEESDFAVQTHARPGMIYDYGGFPEHTYHLKYSSPGAPKVAARITELITAAGFANHQDPARGYDHGMFSPMAAIYPNADVPVLQLSIREDYDPAAHVEIGRALAPLRDEGVLIVGSGLSYHNLRLFGKNETARQASKEFDGWLHEVLSDASTDKKFQRLENWEDAPSARICHPREDHLIPLMVAYGAAENEKCKTVYHETDFMGALTVSSFCFGISE